MQATKSIQQIEREEEAEDLKRQDFSTGYMNFIDVREDEDQDDLLKVDDTSSLNNNLQASRGRGFRGFHRYATTGTLNVIPHSESEESSLSELDRTIQTDLNMQKAKDTEFDLKRNSESERDSHKSGDEEKVVVKRRGGKRGTLGSINYI